MLYNNYYKCVCGCSWQDTSDCCNNDRCPECRTEMEPYRTTDATQFLIIDGHNFTFRAFYVSQVTNNPVETTVEIMIRSLLKQFGKNSKIYVAWDSKINSTARNFRHELSGNVYKQQRDKEKQSDTLAYIEKAKAILTKFNAISIHPSNLEGDDVIRWLSLNFAPSIIVSSDADFIQLINEYTSLWSPTKKVLITTANVTDYTNGIPDLNDWLIYKSILGDKSDNIRGIEGYGPVKAKKMIQLYKDDKINTQQKKIIETNLRIFDLSYAPTVEPSEYEKYQQQLVAINNDPLPF